ncbi:HisA/HisF-related TIM barrel protein [Candidatus Pelagibacter ubique]|nr:HisA/HisF-related TIM barrel protein [Candidatus Pelagibacter ubique]
MNKRLIFCLLFKDNHFQLSRNFTLQSVGDIKWIKNNFSFDETCKSIDEIMFIHAKNNPSQDEKKTFLKTVNNLRKKLFIPIGIGGGIRTIDDVRSYFEVGADKIILNTSFYDKKLLIDLSNKYGAQSISAMIDYKNEKGKRTIYTNSSTKKFNFFDEYKLLNFQKDNIGDLIFNSIDRDGTGQGLDLGISKKVKKTSNPIILMGGAGKSDHIIKSLKLNNINGVATSNIFNFLGKGLSSAREKLFQMKIKVAKF